MYKIIKTMKLHIHVDEADQPKLVCLTEQYSKACNYISEYAFNNGHMTDSMYLQSVLYYTIRDTFGLKAQLAVSTFKTVAARYKTVQEQMKTDPYSYVDENGSRQYIEKTLEWLQRPIVFRRPQADLVRTRDYSFVTDKKSGRMLLSLNTLNERLKVSFDVPECFKEYFDGTWSFGTGKIVSLNGEWYFHIPMSKETDLEFSKETVKHVVGLDRGLRFIITSHDDKGKTGFISGKNIMRKREAFQKVRDELQAKGTKSAKRALKRISGRENRWMTDVNHQISKTLVTEYEPGTLFAIENLAGVSFDEKNLGSRSKKGRRELRSWTFYQLEQFLTYKALAVGSMVLKVKADYTSQRCPKCGRIHKENRHHDSHEYICDCCGYRSNDDRVGAMNIQTLGTMYISGDTNPRFGVRKEK